MVLMYWLGGGPTGPGRNFFGGRGGGGNNNNNGGMHGGGGGGGTDRVDRRPFNDDGPMNKRAKMGMFTPEVR